MLRKKDKKFYYFAPGPYKGEVELRGLNSGSYTISDLSTNEILAIVHENDAKLTIDRSGDIYLKATPADK